MSKNKKNKKNLLDKLDSSYKLLVEYFSIASAGVFAVSTLLIVLPLTAITGLIDGIMRVIDKFSAGAPSAAEQSRRAGHLIETLRKDLNLDSGMAEDQQIFEWCEKILKVTEDSECPKEWRLKEQYLCSTEPNSALPALKNRLLRTLVLFMRNPSQYQSFKVFLLGHDASLETLCKTPERFCQLAYPGEENKQLTPEQAQEMAFIEKYLNKLDFLEQVYGQAQYVKPEKWSFTNQLWSFHKMASVNVMLALSTLLYSWPKAGVTYLAQRLSRTDSTNYQTFKSTTTGTKAVRVRGDSAPVSSSHNADNGPDSASVSKRDCPGHRT